MKTNKSWIYRSIGIIILIFIIIRTDLNDYVKLANHIDLSKLVYASLIVLIVYFLKSFRWKLLLNSQKIKYLYRNAFLAFTSSNFIAFITPGRIGEFVKVLYLKNDANVPVSKSLPSVITDRLFDVYSLMLFGIYGLVNYNIGQSPFLYIVLIISLMFPFFIFNKKLYDLFFKLLSTMPIISQLVKKKSLSIDNMKYEFQSLININLFYASIVSILSYILIFYASFLLAQSVNLKLIFIDVIMIISVANILSFLPITVSGLGTREAVFIYFLIRNGYSNEQALMFSTLFFLSFYIIGGLYGYICFLIKPVSIKNLKKEIK